MSNALLPALLLASIGGCSSDSKGDGAAHQPGVWTHAERDLLLDMRLDTPPPDPTNRVADDPAAAALGQALFFDPGLSGSGGFACSHCHDPERGFADGEAISPAAGLPDRHTPVIPGSQWSPFHGWSGDTDSLWAQAIGPMLSPVEMAGTPEGIQQHVQDRYATPFVEVFGAPPPAERDAEDVVVAVAKAIAAYERALIPEPGRFDAYLDALAEQSDADAGSPDVLAAGFTDEELRGLSLFVRDGRCATCHFGPMLTDGAFHTLGVAEPEGYDRGRTDGAKAVLASEYRCDTPWSDAPDPASCGELRFVDPSFEDFQGAFKTPTLRNVARTAPYFHNGSIADLAGVIAFYDTLPGEPLYGHRELTLQPLELSGTDLPDLIAFLKTLDADVPAALRQPDPPSGVVDGLPLEHHADEDSQEQGEAGEDG